MNLRRFMPKGQVGKSFVTLMSGTAAAQLITIVAMPIVTRLYTPEMMGIISIYLAFFNFWIAFVTLRYKNAMLLTVNEEESHHLFRLGSLIVIFMSILGMVLLGLMRHYSMFGFDSLPSWSPIIAAFSVLGYGWYMMYRAWLLRLRNAKVISLSSIARSGANSGTRLLGGALNWGVYGLFIAEVIGSWAALSLVRTKTKALLKEQAPQWETARIKFVASHYRKFPLFEIPSSIVNQLAIFLPVPIIAALYGMEAAGWFGLARLLYAIPNGQIGQVAGDVFQMELAKYVRNGDIESGKKLFYWFTIRLALFGAFILIVAKYIAPALVPYIFGENWAMMGEIVSLMAPWMFATLVVSSLSRALSVLRKQEWKLIYDSSALLIVLSAYYIASIQKLALLDFVHILSMGMCVAYMIYFLIINYSLGYKKKIN